MVNYSLDVNIRPRVYLIVAVFAAVLTRTIQPYVALFKIEMMVPSAFTLYGILLFIFDRYIWKLPPFPRFHGIPNIAGRYAGTVERGSEGEATHEKFDVNVVISQTWTSIDMVLRSGDTASHLRTCGFFIANDVAPRILYTYLVKDMQGFSHGYRYGEGTAELYIDTELGELSLLGVNYSSKNRSGRVRLEKLKKAR